MEPAGALSVAGMRRYAEREGVSGRSLVALLSGANMNFHRLRFVAERAELGEAHESIRAVTIPERPGALMEFLRRISVLLRARERSVPALPRMTAEPDRQVLATSPATS